MTLEEYLLAKGMTDGAFANAVGVDRSTIARIRKGELNTSRDVMRRIIKASGGQVDAISLIFDLNHGAVDTPAVAIASSGNEAQISPVAVAHG